MKELHSGKAEGGTRVVKLMYKNRSRAPPGAGGHLITPTSWPVLDREHVHRDGTVLWTLVGGPGWLW